MPNFELVPMNEATLKTATGKRAQMMAEYLGCVEQLGEGQAGRLAPGEGERATTVRRRLGDAARLAGNDLVIKRAGDDIYFWVPGPGEKQRRRGRPWKDGA